MISKAFGLPLTSVLAKLSKRRTDMKRNLYLFFLFLLLSAAFPLAVSAQVKGTIRQQMEWLHKTKNVDFVYDATLDVNQQYKGPSLKKKNLKEALYTLFNNSGITYELKGSYVLLHKKPSTGTQKVINKEVKSRHTLSGYVREANGDVLLNATIYDLTTGQGTITNSYGYYSLTLPDGNHQLRISYLGFEDKSKSIELHDNQSLNIELKESQQAEELAEVTVNGDRNSPLLTTQTGKRSLGQADLHKGFALLSSADVVKTLQQTSGVAEGIELTSGMYVHGGNNDENLFLIDGTPLYQINHTLGLFSAFNTDVVKNIDFYKSGFPARYGGRLSSVVDVRTNDGDMYHAHGSYRIGLLDGSLQFEGPITKGKTSYNIGLRRSWLDLLSKPIFAIVNHNNTDGENLSLDYVFHDLNAKITHIFSDRSKMYLSVYSGSDDLNTKDKFNSDFGDGTIDKDVSKAKLSWGNFNIALNWNYRFSPKLFANFTGLYSYNRSKYSYLDDENEEKDGKEVGDRMHYEYSYDSKIHDIGYRMEFDYRPTSQHLVRFGADYTYHHFLPQTQNLVYYSNVENTESDTLHTGGHNSHVAHEVNLYAEDEFSINDQWSLNGGLHLNTFFINGKNFCNFDPRVAIKYQVSPSLSFKMSYTMMSQFVHKISNSYLDLPTDYWVPTTDKLKPMRSYQFAAGIYSKLGQHWLISLEAYYKHSNHLLQHNSWVGLEPPADKWDELVIDGKGKFYGFELDGEYKTKNLTINGSYTLSWNKRLYQDFYPEWYYDKFDNRHKLNLSLQYQITPKINFYAAWTYHTGNRLTLPSHYTQLPTLPGGKAWVYNYGQDNTWGFVYDTPNNAVLPAYHRLDLGCDFHHTTKHGHERIWNFSIYNAYCHLNPLYVDVKLNYKQEFTAKTKGFIPILPSVSYTIKF
jgi:hypothetical protein